MLCPVCRVSVKPVMHNETVCQVSTLLTLLEGCMLKAGLASADATSAPAALHMERIFLYCLSWSLGGLLHEKGRPAFDAELRAMSPAAMPPKVLLAPIFLESTPEPTDILKRLAVK